MAGLVRVNTADRTYEAVDANLVAGTVVIPSATATEDPSLKGIAAAGATALNVLGVAAKDCVTAANRAALSSGAGPAPANFPFVDASVPTATTAVYNDGWFRLSYVAGAVAYGDRIKAGAGGKCAKWVSGTDSAAACIGWCADTVGSGGGDGFLTRINV